jgi:methylated-DNA-protein-cysteine methyltransferase-like protein
LPWYRVINSQGKISFPIDSDKYLDQKKRLENEGVAFLKNRIKLEDFQWND